MTAEPADERRQERVPGKLHKFAGAEALQRVRGSTISIRQLRPPTGTAPTVLLWQAIGPKTARPPQPAAQAARDPR